MNIGSGKMLLIVAALVLTACGPSHTGHVSTATPFKRTPSVHGRNIRDAKLPVLPRSDYAVLGKLPKVSQGSDLNSYLGITDDGMAYGDAGYAKPLDPKTGYYPTSPILANWETGNVTVLSDGRKNPDAGGVWDMTAAPGWVSWTLNASPDENHNNWSVYTYERATGRTRLVARAPRVDGKPPLHAYGGTYPRIIGKSLYFAAVSSMSSNGPVDDVYTVPLNGSKPLRSILHNVDNVTADGHEIFYVNGRGAYLYNVATKETARIKGLSGKNRVDSCFHDGTLAYGTSTKARGFETLKIRQNGHTEDIGKFTTLNELTCTSRWIAYDDPGIDGRSKYYMYDIKRHARYQIPGEVFAAPSGVGAQMILQTAKNHKFAYNQVISLK